MNTVAVILGVFLVTGGALAENKHRSCQNATGDYPRMCMQVLGHSGKIVIGFPVNESSDDPRSADDYIEVRFRSLTELNDNMERVGKGGSNKHSFSSFASLDFEISDLQTVDYDNSTCLKFNMTAQIPMGDDSTDCIMTTDFFIFTEDGENVTIGRTSQNVRAGDIKWNTAIDNWEWCDNVTENCKNGGTWDHGTSLLVHMELSGPNNSLARASGEFQGVASVSGGGSVPAGCANAGAAASNPNCVGVDIVIDFGDAKIGLVLDDSVRYGEASSRTYDSWEQMREGFPDLYDMSNNETSGDKFGLDILFERREGRTSMEYDPIVIPLAVETEEELQAWGPNIATNMQSCLLTMLAAVMLLFV